MSNINRLSSRKRLDQAMVERGLATSRSQAQNYIKLGYVLIGEKPAEKTNLQVNTTDYISVSLKGQYVSRAALKLASVASTLKLNFEGKIVLDVGSSTGGFTDFALQSGAKKVIAIDVGTEQLHPVLRTNPRVELHEQLDIRSLTLDSKQATRNPKLHHLSSNVDIVVIDVSFISLRKILPHLLKIVPQNSVVVAMVKPQFEAQEKQKNKGIVKNERIRREIFKDFEAWVQKMYSIQTKADSGVEGQKGNKERFYLLKKLTIQQT